MKNTLTNLSDTGLLKIHGPDAKKLLQGQITCDVESVSAIVSILGAHCNPQGRVISFFHLFQLEDAYYLLMPRTMIEVALNALKKYAVFYKVKMEDVSNELTVFGLSHSDSPLNDDEITLLTLPFSLSRQLLVGKKETMKHAWGKLSEQATIISPEAWHALEILDGIPTIYPETTAKLLPHDLNLHQLNAINFEKGCYTGQEIIARMHYRGKLKNHLYRVTFISPTAPTPGQSIYCKKENDIQTCGMIVNAARNETAYTDRYHALIVTDEFNAKNQNLSLDQGQTIFLKLED